MMAIRYDLYRTKPEAEAAADRLRRLGYRVVVAPAKKKMFAATGLRWSTKIVGKRVRRAPRRRRAQAYVVGHRAGEVVPWEPERYSFPV